MKTIEKICQKIEELYDGEAPKHDQQCDFSDGYFTGLSVISNFLDTLSEEQDKSLDEAAEEHFETMEVHEHENIFDETHNKIFKAGAEWQKNKMLKDAIPFYEILKAVPSFERENTRIIIVKEEE